MRHAIVVASLTTVLALVFAASAGAGTLDTPGAAKALVCSACHGAGGNSRSETMPVIAGASPAYFKKAIEDYATGKRTSPEMEPYAKMVRELGVDEIAGYFASQAKQPTAVRVDAAAVARGKTEAAACVVCHGANGKGDAAKLIPDLTGQPPGYLRNQLILFKAERRSPGDATLKAMKALIKTIPDETLGDLAAYYSSLR